MSNPTTDERIAALEGKVAFILARNSRLKKIASLESALREAKDILTIVNQNVGFPIPSWYDEQLSARVRAVLHE